MSVLVHDRVKNLMTGSDVLVPEANGFGSGFPCVSNTPLSSRAKDNAGCCQDNRESTGKAINIIISVLEKHLPDDILLECVKQLLIKPPHHDECDAEWICIQVRKLGYWITLVLIDQLTYGACLPRERCWWAGARHLMGDHDKISQHFLSLLRSFKLPPDTVKLADCFTLHTQQREAEAKALGFPLVSESGPGPREGKKSKKEPEYKHIHYKLYTAFGLSWPPCLDRRMSMPCTVAE